jgi:endonuclease/exonuclease/phosphatase (EEP) superfamily protein YafD
MRVLTYNTLAAHLGGSFAAYPGYGDEASLAFGRRAPLLVDEILQHDADVVCLQEVAFGSQEAFVAGLRPAYEKVMFVQKPGGRPDGLLMFARAGMGGGPVSSGTFPGTPQVYLSAVFGGTTVVTTHLKSKPQYASTRLAQVRHLLGLFGAENVVYAGDFNAEPGEACVREMLEGGMQVASADAYTTCKRRDARLVRQIDYVFVPAGWTRVAASRPPALTGDEVFPNAKQGSDHVAVTAIFTQCSPVMTV